MTYGTFCDRSRSNSASGCASPTSTRHSMPSLDELASLLKAQVVGHVHAAQDQGIVRSRQILLQRLDQNGKVLMTERRDHNADGARAQRSKCLGDTVRHPFQVLRRPGDAIAQHLRYEVGRVQGARYRRGRYTGLPRHILQLHRCSAGPARSAVGALTVESTRSPLITLPSLLPSDGDHHVVLFHRHRHGFRDERSLRQRLARHDLDLIGARLARFPDGTRTGRS